ncbi:hypothetical protein ABE473_12840 [Stenotrophomonas sp. TWI700]|uniref:hypothetical protein n=1 Tax=Stenotrophomonas sp. TWI700 TaxID=3136792 RepID=UPI0032093D8C
MKHLHMSLGELFEVIRLPVFAFSVALICATPVVSNDACAAVPDRMTVEAQARVDPLAIQTATAPPVPLPTRGTPGERLTILNELPGGFRERWTFEWVTPRGGGGGGEWKQTHYESLAPVTGLYQPDEL